MNLRRQTARNARPWIYLALATFLIVSSGCPAEEPASTTATTKKQESTAPNVFPETRPDFANGKVIYDKNCAACHGPNGEGDGPSAASFDPKPTDFTDKAFIPRHAPSDLYTSITDGKRAMPAFKATLTDEERWDVFYYLRFFHVSPDVLATGKTIYQDQCGSCHGTEGQGDGQAGVGLDPRPADFTDFQRMNTFSDNYFTETIMNGSGPMPKFEEILTEAEIKAVFEYERTFGYTGAPGL